jgi:NAD-specific glutamate dehydrogenase
MGRGPAALYANAAAHWRLLQAHTDAAAAQVRVFNPTLAEDGFVSEHTVVHIVHANMPFLVDSVTMAVNRGNRTAHWIVHPLLAVQRDASGTVQAASSAATAHAPGTPVESVILVECDRIVHAQDREALQADLQQVLSDVRASVQDWQAMLERARSVAQAAEHSRLSPSGRQEGVDFLRWLEDKHFTFLGARDYDLVRDASSVSMRAKPGTGLGILRGAAHTEQTVLPPEAVALLESNELVLVTKAMSRATVHRPAWLDYIAVKRFDAQGELVGETRFLGLYTSTAYTAPVGDIPQVRSRVAAVLAAAGVVPESHAAKSLQSILDVYPRDELFQIDTPTLTEHAIGILRLQERQRTRVFLRRDVFGRFTSALVFVPRERFNTELRLKIGEELMAVLDGQSVEFTPMLTDSPLARIHYLVRARERAPQHVALQALEARIARHTERWEDQCTTEFLRAHGEGPGLALAQRYADAFPTGYRELFSPQVAVEDADTLTTLSPAAPLAVRGQPRRGPHPAPVPGPHPGHAAHQLVPARRQRRSPSPTSRSSSCRRRSPTCRSPSRCSRSSCTRRASRACTCAAARWRAAACAGRTAWRTSAPRSGPGEGADRQERGDRAGGLQGRLRGQEPRPPSQRARGLLAEGVACYRNFLRGLLDLTDNLVQGAVVPPADVVRHDEDDPYLVVAADKGTASFSDYANQVSAEYGFWLGDAFASGGSVGYDHKKMGITARGAWEAVKRHFREMGKDIQPALHRGRHRRHVGRRVRQRHAAVEADPPGGGLRPPPHLHRPRSRSGALVGRARAPVRAAALELGRLRQAR